MSDEAKKDPEAKSQETPVQDKPKEVKKEPKVSTDELSADEISVLSTLLHSGITIPAKSAYLFVGLQEWISRLSKERGIEAINKDKVVKK